MEISTNIQLIAKPGMGVELLELLKNILPDTRSYDDNLGQYLVSDVEDRATSMIELIDESVLS